MLDVNLCPECNIPQSFYRGHVWLNNGDIVQRVNPTARMAFFECENLDPLYRNISDIVGFSIEPMIINIASRGSKIFIGGLVPREVKDLVRAKQLQLDYFIDSITTYSHIIGYGKYEFLDYRYNNEYSDYAIQRVTEPFSVPGAAGAFAGAIAGVVGGEIDVTYEEESPGVYLYKARPTEYPEELKQKLQMHGYRHREGDIDFERCGTCDLPKLFSSYSWDLENGIIRQNFTGRRMSMLGPELMDPIFKVLEWELGEAVPQVVVEAQRRFVRTGFYSLDILETEADLRTQLALRGLGNLREFKMDERMARLRLDNACLHLIVAGWVQGNFEMTFGIESNIDWELSKEGSLELEITPKRVMETLNSDAIAR